MTLKKRRKHWLHMADGRVDGVIASCFNFARVCWSICLALLGSVDCS
jgi:hypothetical protein